MRFTVVVPVYNVAEFLPRCLNSLLEQTYENIEIILVDDGSTDSSGKICDEYSAKDSRITVVHKPNGGAADARNVGINSASGDYITFVDADDFITTSALEELSPYTVNSLDIIVGNAVETNLSGQNSVVEHFGIPGTVYNGSDYLRGTVVEHKCLSVIWAKLYRREFLMENKLLFKTGRMFEDEEFMPRVFAKAESVLPTGLVLYNYVVREGSTMTGDNKKRQAEDFYLTMKEYEASGDYFWDSTLKKLVLDRMVSIYLRLFAEGNLGRYGNTYAHRAFLLRNACKPRTFAKSLLFGISPSLYCRLYAKK